MGDRISVVISSKYDLEGHKKRIDFIKYLEKYSQLELDILCETFLFYGGPSNVLNIYPQYGYQLLDMDNFEKSMNIMENCISKNVFNLENIRAIKNTILYKNSFSPRIMKTLNF